MLATLSRRSEVSVPFMEDSVPFMEDVAATREAELKIPSFDGVVGRRIIDTHIWAVREGLRGATAYELFDNYCQRLVIHGVPLWRAHAAMETLHPQWSGYGYTWRRDLNAIQPERYARGELGGQDWLRSPMYTLVGRARAGEDDPWMRRRLGSGAGAARFPGAGGVFRRRARRTISRNFSVSAKRRSLTRHRRRVFLRSEPRGRIR